MPETDQLHPLSVENAELRTRLQRAEEALRFYANPQTYEHGEYYFKIPAIKDGGSLARKALAHPGPEGASGEESADHSRDYWGSDPRGMGPLPGEPGNPNMSFEQMEALGLLPTLARIRETNAALGMVPHKTNCRCNECELDRLQSENARLRQGIESLAGGYEGVAEHRCGCCDPDQTMPWCDCDNAEDSVSEGRDQQRLECASALRALLRGEGEQ